jgi:hypothetical protein
MEYFKFTNTAYFTYNYNFDMETYSDFVKEWKEIHNVFVTDQIIEKKMRRDSSKGISVMANLQSKVALRKFDLTRLYEIRERYKAVYKMNVRELEDA